MVGFDADKDVCMTTHTTLKAAIKALPLTQQIALIQAVVESPDFADFDQRALDKIDAGLAGCMERSRADDAAEERRLFGLRWCRDAHPRPRHPIRRARLHRRRGDDRCGLRGWRGSLVFEGR